jgi:hypothetical protein
LAELTQAEYSNAENCNNGEIPLVDLSNTNGQASLPPFRCSKCQGYMNINTIWLEEGRKA